MQVHEKCGLSPGKYTAKHASRLTQHREKIRRKQRLASFKRRRLELKAERCAKDAAKSVLEGDTYETSIDLNEEADIVEIPSIPSIPSDGNTLIFFDLETTGLARTSDITQIAAVSGEKKFNVYVIPRQQITPGASNVTGLAMVGDTLYHKGEAVSATTIPDALVKFLDFVQSFDKPILAGHNIHNFDVPVLYNQLKQCNMSNEFNSSIIGFIDTLKIAKKKVSKDDLETKSYKQENLVKTLLKKTYEAHNALADVTALEELYHSKLELSHSDMSCNLFSFSYYKCSQSLQSLVNAKVISSALKLKLANSSLGLKQLQLAHSRDPEQGIASIFSELDQSKKPRITKSKAVINKVAHYLTSSV